MPEDLLDLPPEEQLDWERESARTHTQAAANRQLEKVRKHAVVKVSTQPVATKVRARAAGRCHHASAEV